MITTDRRNLTEEDFRKVQRLAYRICALKKILKTKEAEDLFSEAIQDVPGKDPKRYADEVLVLMDIMGTLGYPFRGLPLKNIRQVDTPLGITKEEIISIRKNFGLCPKCGEKGFFSHFVLVCKTHGQY